jgi:hypothetical protein
MQMALAQEAMHTIKSQNILAIILKLDLSKAYDNVNWVFLRLALIHMGMNSNIVNWIMGCIGSTSFVVLINGSLSPLF